MAAEDPAAAGRHARGAPASSGGARPSRRRSATTGGDCSRCSTRLLGDIDLAEECAAGRLRAALQRGPRDGVPDKPGAWLTTAARRRALDLLRREETLARKLPLLVAERAGAAADMSTIPDDRLRLVFTCCHPALSGGAGSR